MSYIDKENTLLCKDHSCCDNWNSRAQDYAEFDSLKSLRTFTKHQEQQFLPNNEALNYEGVFTDARENPDPIMYELTCTN